MRKERVRYLNVRFIAPQNINEKDAWFLVAKEVKRLFGVIGAADAGLYLSYFDEESQGGIFRTSHNTIHLIRGAICYIQSHHTIPIFLYSDNLTGSLRKAKEMLFSEECRKKYERIKEVVSKEF